MEDRIRVFVYAGDPISEAGIAGQLRGQPSVHVVAEADVDAAQVAIVVTDEVDEESKRAIKALQRNGVPRVLVVVTRVDDAGLLATLEAGACGLIRRAEARPDRLVAAVRAAAAGDGTMPPDLLGRLLDQVGRLQRQVLSPRGLTLAGLAEREIEVLRLIADGLDTNEIASRLCYSQRTVKNVIHDVTSRLQLRNRSHAVAYAMRQGLI
ncbi:MAG TPA: response regulator transcription factor [Acidimicrobiales bacterium]